MFPDMREALVRAAVGCGLALVLARGNLHAEPRDPPMRAGVQPVPPVRAGEPSLPQELDGRRSIRGCGADERCARPGDLLREFEVEAFPAPGSNPWLRDDRSAPGSRLEPGSPTRIVK